MYKYKKIAIYLITLMYILFTIIEVVKYLIADNTLFGVYYLLICLVIIFFLVPCAYNYKRYFSKARVSKLVIVILLIVFDSYLLERVLFNTMGYIDSSSEYIKSIFLYKNVFKIILGFALTIFTAFEFKLDELIKKSIVNKRLD